MVVQSYFYIIDYGQILEKPDILEGSCDTCLIDVDGLFAGDILAIQGNNSLCGFIYAGQQIKYGGFSGTIGTDQSIQFTFFNTDIKIIYRTKSAKRNA